MKVPLSIRHIYDEHLDLYERLKKEVDRQILSLKQPRWHYESRVKALNSFALKLETGRFADPSKLEDFFACTLVVANALEIDTAEQLICEQFTLDVRRPERENWTHKNAESFPFDDLRLYVSSEQDPALPPSDLSGVIFEVQIKTFLQHAWSIATHDLVYKADDANWSKARIAFQVRAMLEHAELSIQEAERLAESPSLNKENRHIADVRKIIVLLKEHWEEDTLPEDTRRLAENVSNLLNAVRVKIRKLNNILKVEKETMGGTLPVNLSPYAVIVQSLLRQESRKMSELLTAENGRFKVLIPSEIEFPEDMERDTCCNAIFISQP